jgi:ABC-type transport system involved in cytochrome c biogenesis permease component
MHPNWRKAITVVGVLFTGVAVLSTLSAGSIILFVFVLPLYMLPTLIAAQRRVSAVSGIGALNLLLGWTFVGWVLALIWALAAQQKLTPREV